MADQLTRDDPIIRAVRTVRASFDEEAIAADSPQALAMLERILAEPSPVPERTVRRRRWGRPRVLAAAGMTLAATAGALVLAGVFSGPGSSGNQPADAAVLRGVAAALQTKPGTIELQTYTVTGTWGSDKGNRFTIEQAMETPKGPGAQDGLYVTSAPQPRGGPNESAQTGGDQEVYLKQTNTVYITSMWGSYITKGPRPATFVYTPPKPPSGKSATLAPKPITLTVAQAEALRNGTDIVETLTTGKLKVTRAPRFPTQISSARQLLAQHLLKVDGSTTIDRRAAIKLTGPAFDIHHQYTNADGDAGVTLYVDPHTYVPIAETIDRKPLFAETQVWTRYETLPITAANQRLLSLTARHPNARVDRNRRDFQKADDGEAGFPG